MGGWVSKYKNKFFDHKLSPESLCMEVGVCVGWGGYDEGGGGGGHDMFTVLVLKMGRQLLIQQERKNQGRLLNSGLPTFLSGVRSFQIHFIVDRKRKRRSGIPI